MDEIRNGTADAPEYLTWVRCGAEVEPVKIGSGVLLTPRLVLTVKHVVVEDYPIRVGTLANPDGVGATVLREAANLGHESDMCLLELEQDLLVRARPLLLQGDLDTETAKSHRGELRAWGCLDKKAPYAALPLPDSSAEGPVGEALSSIKLRRVPDGFSGGPVLLHVPDMQPLWVGMNRLGGDHIPATVSIATSPIETFLEEKKDCPYFSVSSADYFGKNLPEHDGRPELVIRLRVFQQQVERDVSVMGRAVLRGETSEIPLEVLESPAQVPSGSALREFLFGTDAGALTSLLPSVYGDFTEAPLGPDWQPVRVRLSVSDDEVASYPWPTTTVDKRSLGQLDWTFELVADPPRGRRPFTRVVEFQAPCQTLICAPDGDDHGECVRSILEHAWPLAVDSVHTTYPESLNQALQSHEPPPDLVYLRGSSNGEHALPLAALAEAPNPPQVLLLRLLEAANGEVMRALVSLRNKIPFIGVIWNRPANSEGETEVDQGDQAALKLLRELASGGKEFDPVQALARSAGDSYTALTHYTKWEHTLHSDPLERDLALFHLDRTIARDSLSAEVTRAVHDKRRRLVASVATGAACDHVDWFGRQVWIHLGQLPERLELVGYLKVDWQVPCDSANLESSVREALQLDSDAALDSFAARYPKQRGVKTGVLVLDFGAPRYSQADPVSLDQLEAWFAFCAERLSKACPGHLRILALLGYKNDDPDEQSRAQGHLAEAAHQGQGYERCYHPIPPLGNVSKLDLGDFLLKHGKMPPDEARDLSEEIYSKTKGNFQETVEELRRLLY